MPTKIAYDQHDLLHKNFPGDCCLCKAEDGIRRLEHKLFKLEILPNEEEIKNIINGLTSLALWEAINKEGSDSKIKPEDYSYTGIPPESKEAAVVMLADTVEAASRVLKKPTINKLEKFIWK